MIKQKTVEALD